ncbi:MAG: hypothetical protein J6M34_01065 [Clostridia bacterium]|nr:hypothetical protein [Clostridia bacterium]
MKKEYIISCDGLVKCHSAFFEAHDGFQSEAYEFRKGRNILNGDIDSGAWAISYLLSMYHCRKKDFLLFEQPKILGESEEIMEEIMEKSCYMDPSFPLFSKRKSVRKLIEQGIKKSKSDFTSEGLKELFGLDDQRFERPLSQVGNERYQAMAAIGVAYGMEWFCFPWFSQKLVDYFQIRLKHTIKTLEQMGKVIIFPANI